MDEPRPRTVWLFLESAVVFAFGAALMHFAYSGAGSVPMRDIGVPGHDSFYHIKMAAMLSEHGLVREFPWLKFAYFTGEGPAFVSHHYGFHVLLWPFVEAAQWLTGDPLTGGRWATTAFFGAVAMLFNSLLIRERVPWRPFWILWFALLPYQFFTRHALVRAITPSLAMMLLLVWLLHARRYLWSALTIAAFTHLYLGGVIYAPVVVFCVAAAQVLGPKGDRTIPIRLVLTCVAGWLIGVVTYPYASGTWEFLKLQVFGSGLSPDIGVGQEWYPYENVWWFARMCGPLLSLWAASLLVRLRWGPTIHARELSMILLTLAFLILNLKARRFIEYWPIFGLFSSAQLFSPQIRKWAAASPEGLIRRRTLSWQYAAVVSLVFFTLVCIPFVYIRPLERVRDLLPWWPLFGAIAAIYLLFWFAGRRSMKTQASLWWDAGGGLAVGAVLLLTATTLAAPLWQVIRRDSRCQFDLPAVRSLMDFLVANSDPGDVVFTDDWDIFPIYFYHNTHNHYIVGLDPKFTHGRRPELWERYVKISRGQVPVDATVARRTPEGRTQEETIHVRLEDIREYFGARFVITDRDHHPLAAKLVAAPHLAQLIFPSTDYSTAKDQPFLLFRILRPGEETTSTSLPFQGENFLYVSAFRPIKAEQGWGDLSFDRSVTSGPIQLGTKSFARGLGTHAPSTIEYRIPDGFDRFESVVGVDRGAGGNGSVNASVFVDDEIRVTSPLLTGNGDPFFISVDIRGARRLRLQADPTSDGQRYDHVDWADARLVRDSVPRKP